MTPERWQQVKAIFNSAMQYQPEERNSFLSEACSGDESLRSEVESLLASHEKSGEFIDQPAYQKAPWLAEEVTELKAGQQVGSYRIVSFISRGGMGEVYLAHDQRLNRKVALKLLPTSFTKDMDRLRRFEQEARSASALNHPNIITIYEIQQLGATHVIATEFVEGETLRDRLRRSLLSLSEALNISIQIADALSAAHKAGIIHRDIKPENIMIRPDGYVKVLDFGLAKLSEAVTVESFAEAATQKIKTGSGVILGTVGYMSPEQARGQTIDARSDIFNLGAVIYEMVAGQKPFRGETSSDVFASILKVEPRALSQVTPETPAELERIVTKALRKDRELRYQGVKDLLIDLKSLNEDLLVQAKLNRSVPSGVESQKTVSTSQARQADTDELRTAVSTITHSLSVEIKRHKVGVSVLAGVAALLLITGAIGLYKLLNRGPAQSASAPPLLQTSQITFSSGLDAFPSLSPDGKSVAYSSDQNGSFEIYVKQLTPGGGELQLTHDGQQNTHPSWSPDGQRIAYYSRSRQGIWVVSALGGTPKQLTDFGAKPVWSPDGSMIAFQSASGGEVFTSVAIPPSTIWIVSAQGGTPKQITQPGNPPGGHSSPSWSPDGKRIAFAVADYILSSVWTVTAEGTDPKRIARGGDPIYSPDGTYIYFISGHSGGGLSRIPISPTSDPIGEPTVVVEPGPGMVLRAPVLSSDGKRLIYGAHRTVSNLSTVSLLANGDPAGPPAVFSRDTSQRNNLPAFSPDGRKIALNRWRPGMSADIWVADADGKNLTQITNNPATDSQASWLPGSDKLAFLSNRNTDHMMVWTISLTTGKEEPLLDLGPGVEFGNISPDGSQFAYNFSQNGVMNVWIAGLKDGQRRQLTSANEMAGFPCWSPDGQFIAYEVKHDQADYLMVIPASGGEPTQLTFDNGKSWPHSFSPDGNKVVFAGQRDGIWNIYWVSRSNKIEKQLTNNSKLNVFVRYPAWSPQGNQIVYENAETTGNIWMAELK